MTVQLDDLPQEMCARMMVGWYLQEFANSEFILTQALGLITRIDDKWPEVLLEHLPIARKLLAFKVIVEETISDKVERDALLKFVKGMQRANERFRIPLAHYRFRPGAKVLEVMPLKGDIPKFSWTLEECTLECAKLFGARRPIFDLVDRLSMERVNELFEAFARNLTARNKLSDILLPRGE